MASLIGYYDTILEFWEFREGFFIIYVLLLVTEKTNLQIAVIKKNHYSYYNLVVTLFKINQSKVTSQSKSAETVRFSIPILNWYEIASKLTGERWKPFPIKFHTLKKNTIFQRSSEYVEVESPAEVISLNLFSKM